MTVDSTSAADALMKKDLLPTEAFSQHHYAALPPLLQAKSWRTLPILRDERAREADRE